MIIFWEFLTLLYKNIHSILWSAITAFLVTGIAIMTVIKLEDEIKRRKEAEKELKKSMVKLKKAKEMIEQEKQRLHAVFSSMGEGLMVCDKEGTIQLLNQAAGVLLRSAPLDAMGKNLQEVTSFYTDDPKKEVLLPNNLIKKVLDQPDVITISPNDRIYCKNKISKSFPIFMMVAPIIENDVGAVVILFRDATKEYEIDKAKSEFVSIASHQLRTPLSTIAWYSQMLLGGDAGKINKEQNDYLEQICRSNQRMVDLVNSLLDVSRIEMGSFAINPSSVNFCHIVEDLLKEMKNQLAAKKIKVQSGFCSKCEMNADKKLLGIVVGNLLSNAIKYTPDKGKIDLSVNKEKNGSWLISIKDSGLGIPKNEQHKIFSKMFRASNVLQKEIEGNGLGLYIVKSIVENAGGKIWFESFENKGTSFYVSFPAQGMKAKEGIKQLV